MTTMNTKQRLIKICFEDLETGYVLATIPDTMNNSKLKWCFDCILKDLSEKDIVNDEIPNIEWLCEMMHIQFPDCSFLPLQPDMEWCDNSPKCSFVLPPFLKMEQRNILTQLQSQYPILNRYIIKADNIENQETHEQYDLQSGLSKISGDIRKEPITCSPESVVELFYDLLDQFHITYK